jgi:deoxyribodipyrimidine photo-lyase
MIAARRPCWNFALERAVAWAVELKKPILVVEALRAGYRWASDRLHAFVLQGMADNARVFTDARVRYYPYVEPHSDAGKGLVAALASQAALIVTDDFPALFLRRMARAASAQTAVRFEAVDSNGLLPLRATDRAYPTASGFRRALQARLPEYLAAAPAQAPLRAARHLPRLEALPRDLEGQWPPASPDLLAGRPQALAQLPIDHRVPPVTRAPGGCLAAERTLARFIADGLPRYAERRAQPDEAVTSGLSPYLHFGHVSAHDIFDRVMTRERWTTRSIRGGVTGRREGWWGVGREAEAFLDELVTWRELGYNMCHHRPDCDRYESLPDWALATLARHAGDARPIVYTRDQLEQAVTHDPLWNAAQAELRHDGRIHNYLRMLWGKKILEWSPTPQEALATMIDLNNKYAIDGRDPNSYSGICWVLGRYDRPWGPERPIFGTVRYMSSENTARKLKVRAYIRRYSHLGSQ